MGSSPLLWFCACKTATLAYELLVSICSSPQLWFLYAKQRLEDLHKSLYEYQTSPVVLCIQTSVISTRIASFYGFQTSPVVYACKTAPLGLKLQVSVGPRPHLWFCMQNSDFWSRITSLYASQTWPVILCMYKSVISIRITSLYGSQLSSEDFVWKTVSFGPE